MTKKTNKSLANRKPSGVILPLAAGLLIIITIIGIAIYFVALSIGGHREVTNATDAGALQVGRDSVTVVKVPLQASERRFAGLGDPRTSSDEVDLLTFNKLVGMTLLVQMNAAADGTAEARANADALVNLVEGPGGVGDRLKNELAVGNNFSNSFTSTFNNNSTRMTGPNAGQYLAAQHEIAFAGQAGEALASNLDIQRLSDPAQSPVVDFATDQALALPSGNTTSSSGRSYLSGYKPISALPGGRPLLAVPVLPGQTHLLSAVDFTTDTSFFPANTVVPPNAFRSHSSTADRRSQDNVVQAASIAGVGVPLLLEGARRSFAQTATTFNAEIPRGYITVYNNGQALDSSGVLSAAPNNGGTLDFSGFVLGDSTNNVTANQFGVGIDLDPDAGFFSIHDPSSQSQVSAWKFHQVKHPGYPKTRSTIDPPHPNPYYESVCINDSHRDYCWRNYRGNVPLNGTNNGVAVDAIDPLLLEEKFVGVPNYNQLYDPRPQAGLGANPLSGEWKNSKASDFPGYATQCGNGTIAPSIVQDSLEAHWLPYHNLDNPIETVTDTSLSNGSKLAQDMWSFQQFDNAFFGCGAWSYGIFGTVNNVTATEALKLAVIDAYGKGPSPGVGTCKGINPSFTSGLRKFNLDPANGNSVPYAIGAHKNSWSDPAKRGVVSRAGTLSELFEQTSPGSAARLRRFLKSRMQQIKSETSDAEVDAILNTTMDTAGAPSYIYLNSANSSFVISRQPPPAAADVPTPDHVDGRVFTFSRQYDLLDTLVNPAFENDIHDHLFMNVPTNSTMTGPPTAQGRDQVQFATSSGYNLELGKISFSQGSSGDLELCDRN